MSIRVAFASSDGLVINQHFGHADRFYVAEIGDGAWRFVETRSVERVCRDFEHSEGRLDAVLRVLSDCRAVFVNRIGYGASAYLIGKGIRVFETADVVEDVLDHLAKTRLLEEEAKKN